MTLSPAPSRRLILRALGLSGLFAICPPSYASALPTSWTVRVEIVDRPRDMEQWSIVARDYLKKWYPFIVRYLRPSSTVEPAPIRVAIFENSNFVAFTRNSVIVLSAPYFRKFPQDLGALAHEAVHVVQSYPRHHEAWVSEGIADFVRYYVVEPGSPAAKFDENDTFRRGYQPAAALLNWLKTTRHDRLIHELDSLLAESRYSESYWMKRFGESIDALWLRFRKS